MDLGSIFLTLALLVLVGLFVSRPFFAQKSLTGNGQAAGLDSQFDHKLSSLLAERDRLINALQELDFDYTLGKIPAEDYPAQRAVLLNKGAAVLRELDTLSHDDALPGASPETDAEARLEAAIAARRADASRASVSPNGANGKHAVAPVATVDDETERLLADRRRARQEKAAGFCPQCGGTVQKSDRFCPKCGHTLA
jgi:hypothetical protein